MTILVDHQIEALCRRDPPLIAPFVPEKRTFKRVSYGLSEVSYDFRLGKELAFFRLGNEPLEEVTEADVQRFVADWHILRPGDFALATTCETVCMPDNVTAIVHDKSTWARVGLAVQNTLVDPGFVGQVTLELTNHSPRPLVIHAGQGICQFVFEEHETCRNPYRGKYIGQVGVTLARSSAA